MINTSDHLHLACIGFAEYALVCSWASALGPLVLSTRSALGMRSLIKRWLRPEVHARSRARRRSSERRRAWSDFPGGSAQWWRQTRQPLLRKALVLLGQRAGPSAGGASRKVQLILSLDLENALEAFWSAAEERTGPSRQRHGGRYSGRRAGGCEGQICSAGLEFSNSSFTTNLWL